MFFVTFAWAILAVVGGAVPAIEVRVVVLIDYRHVEVE